LVFSRLGRGKKQWAQKRTIDFDPASRNKLNHPNIGLLYGVEESGGRRALVLCLASPGPCLCVRHEPSPPS
jgi:hypothetical protein